MTTNCMSQYFGHFLIAYLFAIFAPHVAVAVCIVVMYSVYVYPTMFWTACIVNLSPWMCSWAIFNQEIDCAGWQHWIIYNFGLHLFLHKFSCAWNLYSFMCWSLEQNSKLKMKTSELVWLQISSKVQNITSMKIMI